MIGFTVQAPKHNFCMVRKPKQERRFLNTFFFLKMRQKQAWAAAALACFNVLRDPAH